MRKWVEESRVKQYYDMESDFVNKLFVLSVKHDVLWKITCEIGRLGEGAVTSCSSL